MIEAGLLVEGASSYGSGVSVRSRPDQTSAGHRISLIFDLWKLQVLIPKRMLYGFCNTPFHFSRTIARVIGSIKGCVNYMDNIILTGDLAVDLLDTLDRVLDSLKKAGFKINLSKVSLFKKKIKLLGVVFSPAEVSSDPNKIAAITAIPTNHSYRTQKVFGRPQLSFRICSMLLWP